MDHQQERHERHEQDRAEKRAEERRAEAEFSKPGQPTFGPLWFWAAGIVLCVAAIAIWMRL